MDSTSHSPTAFEHFIYAWSDHGLEGRLRYQVAAATPGIGRELRSNSGMLDIAAQLSAWELAPTDPSDRVLGWRLGRLGMFTWLKRRVDPDHWAFRGGHVVHVFHSRTAAQLPEICALIDRRTLTVAEAAAAETTELPPVAPPTYAIDFQPEPDDLQLAELLVAVALTRNGSSAAAIAATSEQMIVALQVCAERCALPIMTARNLSTSQPFERARGHAIVGVGPDGGGARKGLAVPVDTVATVRPQAARAAHRAVRNPSFARAALRIASEGTQIDAELFEAVVLFLAGDAETLTTANLQKVLANQSASDEALGDDRVRRTVIDHVVRETDSLGKAFVSAASSHPRRRAVAGDLARRVSASGFSEQLWTCLGETPALRGEFVRAVARRAPGRLDQWGPLPSEMSTQLVVVIEAHNGGGTEAHERVVTDLIGRIAESRNMDVGRALVPLADAHVIDIMHRWWFRQRRRDFTDAVRALDSHRLSGCGFVFGEQGQHLFPRWAESGPRDRRAAFKLAWAVARTSSSGVELLGAWRWLLNDDEPLDQQLDLIDRTLLMRESVAAHDASTWVGLVDAAASIVEKLLWRRAVDRKRVHLTSSELELCRRVQSDSERARQIYEVGRLRLELAGERRLDLDGVRFRLHSVSARTTLCRSAGLMFIDVVEPFCADSTTLSGMVEAVSKAENRAPGDGWQDALLVFDASARRSTEHADRFASAARKAARSGQFGATFRTGRLPRDLNAWVQRWKA